MAVGDCSVTERRRWRPPYQTGKTVHVHAKHYTHNKDGRTAPGVCGNGSVPLSHSGNVVTRIGIHRRGRVLDCRSKGPRFDPQPGHENFLRVRDKWRPTLGAICHGLLKNFHAPAGDRTGDPSIYSQSTLPRRYKSRLVPQGSTSVLYT